MEVIIALGSNLGDRDKNIANALKQLAVQVGAVVATSANIQTPALSHPDNKDVQADYLNAVAIVDTELEPNDLMKKLLQIESQIGRNRELETKPWSARVIDLDVVVIGDLQIDSEELKVPHPQMHKRDFVLRPLMEVAPNWVHPTLGKTAEQLLGYN